MEKIFLKCRIIPFFHEYLLRIYIRFGLCHFTSGDIVINGRDYRSIGIVFP